MSLDADANMKVVLACPDAGRNKKFKKFYQIGTCPVRLTHLLLNGRRDRRGILMSQYSLRSKALVHMKVHTRTPCKLVWVRTYIAKYVAGFAEAHMKYTSLRDYYDSFIGPVAQNVTACSNTSVASHLHACLCTRICLRSLVRKKWHWSLCF